MKLYISGPITGIPGYNRTAFLAAEAQLGGAGFDVLNPIKLGAGEPGTTWADYLRRDLKEMLTCDGLAMLDGWQASRGAKLEHHVAEALGMPIRMVHSWLSFT